MVTACERGGTSREKVGRGKHEEGNFRLRRSTRGDRNSRQATVERRPGEMKCEEGE